MLFQTDLSAPFRTLFVLAFLSYWVLLSKHLLRVGCVGDPTSMVGGITIFF